MFVSVKSHHLWLAGIAGVLMILLGVLLLVLPHLLSQGALKQKAISGVEAKLGGALEYQQVSVQVWPRPGLVVHGGRWRLAQAVVAKTDTITVYPRLLPLLIGKLRLARVEMAQPVVDLKWVSATPSAAPSTLNAMTAIENQFYTALAALLEAAPSAALQVHHGRLNLSMAQMGGLTLEDIAITIDPSPQTIQIAADCRSEAWRRMVVAVALDTKARSIAGSMRLEHLAPARLWERVVKGDSWTVSGTIDALDITFEAYPDRRLQAQMTTHVSALALATPQRRTQLKDLRMEGNLRQVGERISATLSRLSMAQPQAHVTGKLEWERTAPQIDLRFQGTDVNVAPIRQAALHLGRHSSTVQDIFNYIRGGRVPKIDLRMTGTTWEDIDRLENISIAGEITAGKIFAPTVSLVAEEVAGAVVVENGVLQGKNLKARYARTFGESGILRVALREGLAPFYFNMHLVADASVLPSILKRLSTNDALRREMEAVTQLGGSAEGQVTIGTPDGGKSTRVAVDVFNINARYGRIPSPIVMQGGPLVYSDGQISVSDMSGSIGASTFSDVSGALQWGQAATLRLSSGAVNVQLAEVYPWLIAPRLTRGPLQHTTSMTGRLSLGIKHLAGPPADPAQWDYRLTGDIEQATLTQVAFPSQIKMQQAAFDAAPAAVSLTGAKVSFADTVLTVDGRLPGATAPQQASVLTFSGEIGAQTLDRMSAYTDLPLLAHLRTPLRLETSQVVWQNSDMATFAGQLFFADGLKLGIDVRRDAEALDVRRLTIRDAVSQAEVAVRIGKEAITWQFQGHLVGTSIKKVLTLDTLRFGRIRGVFKGRLTPRRILPFSVEGRLECQEIDAAPLFGLPLTIDQLAVEAQPAAIEIETAALNWKDVELKGNGQIAHTDSDMVLNLSVTGESIGKSHLEGKAAAPEPPTRASASWVDTVLALPLKGKIDLQLKQLSYANHTWRPFKAEISLGDRAIGAEIYDARLCGIPTPGRLEIRPSQVALTVRPAVQNQALRLSADCLQYLKGPVDGTFYIKASVTGQGAHNELIRNLKGEIDLTAWEGMVYQSLLFSRIFAVLNITEIFWGQFPDFQQEGFAYQTIEGRAVLAGGEVNIERLHLNGNAMELAVEGKINLVDQTTQLMVLVSPLKTLNRMVRNIPVVNDILAGNFIAIPLAVSGKLDAPSVEVMPVSAVGSGLLGILERTLKAPVKLFEPALRTPTLPLEPQPDDDRGE